MDKIHEHGKVCRIDNVVFMSYWTSPVLSERFEYYINLDNNRTVNIWAGSHTQFNYSPIHDPELEEEIQIIINNTNLDEIVFLTKHQDLWQELKMKQVKEWLK